MIRQSIAGGLCLALMGVAHASETTTTERTYARQRMTMEQRAAQWDLRPDEWQRYEQVMEGPRGHWSPDLDPVWVLGIHAETESDRRRYAELAVEREKARVEAELAFQRAYDDAWRRLYPDVALIDAEKLASQPSGVRGLQPGDRLMMFVAAACNQCDRWVGQVLSAVNGNAQWQLDIYVAGMESDEAIRRWAASNQIPGGLVHRRRITLNHDNGTLERLTGKATDTVPVLLLRRDGQTSITTPSQLRLP